MSKLTPSPEQAAIIEAATETKENLLISARAGSAKTTTLAMIAEALPRKTTGLYLAFNKRIVEDVKDRLPSNFTCKTLNALGHAAWADKLSTRLRVQSNKLYSLLKEYLDAVDDDALREELSEEFGNSLRDLRLAKASGHVPDAIAEKYPKARPLIDDAHLYALFEEEPGRPRFEMYLSILSTSFEQAMEGLIDFDDQVLMPTVMRATFPPYKVIMIDEAQDLSELNHAMLERVVGKRRLIAVGDECQAIYAFRGAYEDGMTQLQMRFHTRPMALTTSFRCPTAVVDHVQWRAPDMKAWEHSPEGQVLTMSYWDFDNIPKGSAIICRNNAPLLSLAIAMIREGYYPKVWGNDIAAGIIKQLTDLGAKNMSRDSALQEITKLHEAKSKRARNLSALADRMECLRIFVREAPNLGAAIARAERVFNTEGQIHLMTGHKSKGHEFNTVFFYDAHLVGDEGQERNLRYVICTRAQRELIYIDSENNFTLNPPAT